MRKVWKSARERKRRAARFVIRERVGQSHANSDDPITGTSTSTTSIGTDSSSWMIVDGVSKLSVAETPPVLASLVDDENDHYHNDTVQQQQSTKTANTDDYTNTMITADIEDLKLILTKIHAGARSFFSLTLLARQFDLLSTPIPTDFLLEHLPTERIFSCFGSESLKRIQEYLQSLQQVSLVEYTALIGRFHLLGALLLGGVSPCTRGHLVVEPSAKESQQQPASSNMNDCHKMEANLRQISHQILQRFFDFFPLSLSSYIVKRMVDMRLQSSVVLTMASTNNQQQCSFTCQLCQEEDIPISYQLVFTNDDNTTLNTINNTSSTNDSCGCTFCELCFWKDILHNIDARTGEDVVICPCCCLPGQPQPRPTTTTDETISVQLENDNADTTIITSPKSPIELAQASKQRFDLLPIDSIALKRESKLTGRKRRKIPEAEYLSPSWSKGVVVSMGLCQSVRQDKLFTYVDKGAIHFVQGCLEIGVDINASNEYGQTPLYIAAWYGDAALVNVLLAYGANPWMRANGNLSLDGMCRAQGHTEIHKTVQSFREEHWENSESLPDHTALDALHCLDETTEPSLQVLIKLHCDHPGAGSFLISNCIQAAVKPLVNLWEQLPIDQSSAKTAKKFGACSDRSYYCDAESWVRDLLKRRIVEAICREEEISLVEGNDVIVLPQMRFLNYIHVGSSLAPHVDLCRVDQASGQRSTHSFLLYLTTCETGGETTLLQDLSGEVALAKIKPSTGHLLLFPHDCPHEGNEVHTVPKLLIRGEVILVARNDDQ